MSARRGGWSLPPLGSEAPGAEGLLCRRQASMAESGDKSPQSKALRAPPEQALSPSSLILCSQLCAVVSQCQPVAGCGNGPWEVGCGGLKQAHVFNPHSQIPMPRWTSEARLKQAERIRALCPWTKSTGPRTEAGKARAARNAWKGGVRVIVAQYSQVLRGMEATTRALISSFCRKPFLGHKRAPRAQRWDRKGGGASLPLSGLLPMPRGRDAPPTLFSSFCPKPCF